MQKYIIIVLLLGLFPVSLLAQYDCPPVKQLKEIYQSDPGFREIVRDMFDGIKPLPDGTTNPWKDKSFTDLCSYLNEWYSFIPGFDDGLDKIIEFTFLYYNNPAGLKFIREEPGRSWAIHFAEERGKFMDSRESAKGVQRWLDDPLFDNSDFATPDSGYNSFNDFFTRDLKPGVRPVDDTDDNSILVSPADGIVNMIETDLVLSSELPTKGAMTMSLLTLLDSSKYAKGFTGGTAMAVFLMPTDYHHYHAPVSGRIVESKEQVGVRLFGMPDILDMINGGNPGYGKDYSVLEDFRHGYFIFETEEFGHIAMIPIGLMTVGSVVFEEPFKHISTDAPVTVYKGQKLGHFAYGGSTILLVFEKGRFEAINVRQGQRIGVLNR